MHFDLLLQKNDKKITNKSIKKSKREVKKRERAVRGNLYSLWSVGNSRQAAKSLVTHFLLFVFAFYSCTPKIWGNFLLLSDPKLKYLRYVSFSLENAASLFLSSSYSLTLPKREREKEQG